MSIASISYSSLSNAAGEAKDVSKKLGNYADAISSKVCKKLDKYDGKWTGNLSSARNNANSKIQFLENESRKYETYSSDLKNLKNNCNSTDVAVKNRVSSLTAQFKSNNGIRNSAIANGFNYFMKRVGNKTAGGRYVNNGMDRFDQGKQYIKDSIKEWYNVKGGKEAIKGIASAVLGAVVAIAGLVLTCISGGAFAIVVAAVATIIAVGNAVVNVINEVKAYNIRQDPNGSPSRAYRLSKLDTFADSARVMSNKKFWHTAASVVEGVEFVCGVIQFASSMKNLCAKGYKWATGNKELLSKIRVKDIFSKQGLSSGFSKVKDTLCSFKNFNWAKAGDAMKNFKTDFLDNLSKMVDFKDFKSGVSSIKSIASIAKTCVDKFYLENNKTRLEGLFDIGKDFALDSIRTGEYEEIGYDVKTGKQSYSTGWMKASDFSGAYDKVKGYVTKGTGIKGSGFHIDSDVMNKLSSGSKVNASIPKDYAPKTSLRPAA